MFFAVKWDAKLKKCWPRLQGRQSAYLIGCGGRFQPPMISAASHLQQFATVSTSPQANPSLGLLIGQRCGRPATWLDTRPRIATRHCALSTSTRTTMHNAQQSRDSSLLLIEIDYHPHSQPLSFISSKKCPQNQKSGSVRVLAKTSRTGPDRPTRKGPRLPPRIVAPPPLPGSTRARL